MFTGTGSPAPIPHRDRFAGRYRKHPQLTREDLLPRQGAGSSVAAGDAPLSTSLSVTVSIGITSRPAEPPAPFAPDWPLAAAVCWQT
jgi:hypothetical protein